MKKALLILVTSSSIFAMDHKPQSKKDCFASYIRYKDLITTCQQSYCKPSGRNGVVLPDTGARAKCVNEFFETFLTECAEEAAAKKQALFKGLEQSGWACRH